MWAEGRKQNAIPPGATGDEPKLDGHIVVRQSRVVGLSEVTTVRYLLGYLPQVPFIDSRQGIGKGNQSVMLSTLVG